MTCQGQPFFFCSETLTQASQRQPFIPKSTHDSEIMLVVRLHVANVQPVCLETANEFQVDQQLKKYMFLFIALSEYKTTLLVKVHY